MKKKTVFFAMLALTFTAGSASALVIDYYDVPPEVIINGAIINEAGESHGEGSGFGAFNPFLRSHLTGQGDIERGYNTDYTDKTDPTFEIYETMIDPHTHSVLVDDLAVITVDGIDYYELILDLQEPEGSERDFKEIVTLHTLEIWQNTIPDDKMYSDGLGTLKWSLDGGAGGDVALNLTDLYAGQGQYDYQFLIPTSIGLTGDYFYLYNEFGIMAEYNPDFAGFEAEGAFEEWSARLGERPPDVPEPATLLLFGTGLAGLAAYRRRMKK